MYEEDKFSINWFKIVVRLVLILLIVLLSIKLMTVLFGNKTNVKESSSLQESLSKMEQVSKEYFKGDKLPTEVGGVVEVSLDELIKEKLIKDIKDEKGKKCDYKKSAIKAIRLDDKYQIKATLVCNNFNDYKNTFIKIDNQKVKVTTTTKNVTTKKVTTTKKAVVNKKKYTVSFNTNGGEIINTKTVIENQTIGNVVPVRSGYKFLGWYYHGTRFDMNTKIKQNYVLTAKWVEE